MVKIKQYFVFILGLLSFNCIGQKECLTIHNSLDEKLLVLELTEAYFLDYIVEKKGKSNEIDGANNFRLKFIENVENIIEYPDEVIAFLNITDNGWSNGGDDVFNQYYISIEKASTKDSIYLTDIYKPNKLTNQANRNQTFERWLDKKKQVIKPESTITSQSTLFEPLFAVKKALNQTSNIPESNHSDISLLFFSCLILLLVLLVTLFLFLQKSIKSIKERIKSLEDETLEPRSAGNIDGYINRIISLEDQIKQLDRNLARIPSTRENEKSNTSQNSREDFTIMPSRKQKNNNKPPTKVEEIESVFLPPPYEEKKFNAKNGTLSQSDRTLYKVEIKKGQVTGELSFVQNRSLFQSALDEPDRFIHFACETRNTLKSHHSSIKMINTGRIQKSGDDWIVIKKVTVEFN